MSYTGPELKQNISQPACSCMCTASGPCEEQSPYWKRQAFIIAVAGGILLLAGHAVHYLTSSPAISLSIYIAVVVLAGRNIYRKAFRAIRSLKLDMNCLMGIAALGSFFIGHGEEGAAVIYLFFIAESLEEYASENARRSMHQLLSFAPEKARVKRDAGEVELNVHEVDIGETISIRPGEKIPLDGAVRNGSSSVNESAITGEAAPVEKAEGDRVFAGTMNEDGYLEVTVEKRSEDTLLAKIVKLVEEAENRRSGTERLVDRFAHYYTPSVIALAAAIFLVPVVGFGHQWDVWFYRALVLLVVSCPCAFAISTPVAMVSALTSAARHGVLIKGASLLEELSRIRACAFDKTGTLTGGSLEVMDIICFNGHSPQEVLAVAASLESRSEHPIAKAVMDKARRDGISLKEVHNFRAVRGRGISGQIRGEMYYAGAKNLFDELSIGLPAEISRFENEGRTLMFIANEEKAVGVIAFGDTVRGNAHEIIQHLKKRGIRTDMLTGDNEKVARALAETIGIDEYHAGLLPGDKVRVVESLRSRFGSIAMVGDGVNDAPALAAANVGIAMGTTGSDVAIETADIALVHDDLSKIDYLISLSRKTMHVVKQNITVSLLVKGGLTLLASLGLINLWVAVGVGDMGLSLAVIVNSMRLTRIKA